MSQEHYDKVSALMDVLENCNEWEYDFLMHMADFEERGDLFSVDQERTIDELHFKLLE